MRARGLNPPEPLIPSGQKIRFPADSSDKKNSAWYVGFQNSKANGEPYCVFVAGNWQTGEKHTIISGNVTLDKFDRKRADEQVRKAQKAAEEERKKLANEAAERADERWEELTDDFGKNEYLEKKGIAGLYGARIEGFNLVIPMRNEKGELRNLETISNGGAVKKGIFGGERSGLWHEIGPVGDVIYLCEGFSTAVSVHVAMGECAVVAFNANNLVPVATHLAKKYPKSRIVVAADNDQFNEINAGLEKAKEAAGVCGGKYVAPKFKDLDGRPTDWNDLFLREGAEEVFNQISAINPKEVAESFDVSYIVNAPYPDENPKTFAKKGTMANIVELLRRLRVEVRYNVISKEEEILIPNSSFLIDNMATATRSYIIDWCERVGIPYGNIDSYITTLANANPYNPVAAWIDSKPWDGESRLEDLYKTIVAKNEDTDANILCMKEKLIRTWMISAVRAAYSHNGISAHGVLVLQGAQYVGKTAWFKSLVPHELGVIADGLFLRPDDRDSVFQTIRYWLVELGELDATFRKSDIAQLKSFVTRDRDVLRRSHAKKESSYSRRTVFFGSVNPEDFLKDPTGNRRFWTIACESINHKHGLDMQQIWAEIKVLVDKGESHVLRAEEIDALNHHNEDFQEVDPIEERILSYYGWKHSLTIASKTATDVCLDIGIHNPTKVDVAAAGRALKKITGKPGRKSNGRRVYDVPIKG